VIGPGSGSTPDGFVLNTFDLDSWIGAIATAVCHRAAHAFAAEMSPLVVAVLAFL
jgi:hypothetical protein